MTPHKRLEDQLSAYVAGAITGAKHALPDAGEAALQWFVDLHRSRAWTQAGPAAITYSEIKAYAELMRWPLHPQDVDLICAMDREYLEAFRKQELARAGQTPMTNRPAQEVNPAAFDAVFG